MSIVSETEMKEFFQRLIDSVAELSTQASKVEGLEQRVNELADRLRSLDDQNNQLRRDLDQANGHINHVQSELDSTKQRLDNEQAVTHSLRETIVQRDAGVQSLEQSFRQEQDAHKITTSERDDARTKVNELESALEGFRSNLNSITEDRNTWRNLATDHEREVSQLKAQLEKINSVLNPLRVVSSDVA